ncbi:MAG: 2-oxoglutarate dehydrogenase E1 component [Alphaproteobacteria bacterium]|nr:2-oxoglutarate dehydrogenase E1 component [Alphaproteobacteria bacterium]
MQETSWLFGTNETYLLELYAQYKQAPQSVSEEWHHIFAELKDSATKEQPSWARRESSVVGAASPDSPQAGYASASPPPIGADQAGTHRQPTLDSIRALMLIRAYRVRGHLQATLDPLGLAKKPTHPELDPETYGFFPSDFDRPIYINHVLGMETATLRQIMKMLKETYCGSIGVEFMHISIPEEKSWIQERMESVSNHTNFTKVGKQAILQRLTESETFEKYLDRKYAGAKRFGLDGGESVVPSIEQLLKRSSQLGVIECVVGMAHRGRLNFLANIMNKPYQAIFSEFSAGVNEASFGSGDVKYHLGTSADRVFDDRTIHLSLTANPSHLEAVNTVVLGKVLAKQQQYGDVNKEKVMGLLLHGDAAFSGQGIAAETLLLSQIDGYSTGGTIHLVINNQIGFTTAPGHSRSSPYCSDVGKTVSAPIFHVNGDDPEACVHVTRIAAEYRHRFQKDVVIDLWCYRRHGHNESDEPHFTQPLMYKAIDAHPTTRTLYAEQLVREGVITAEEAKGVVDAFKKRLDDDFEAAKSYSPNKEDWLEGKWTGIKFAKISNDRRGETFITEESLQQIATAISKVPPGFSVHRKLKRVLESRHHMFETGAGFDWGAAEALAIGGLLRESTPVRYSGEDSQRGTFSHRHAVLVDQNTEQLYTNLNHIQTGQAKLEILNSPLSEYGVLGFEYGFSLAEPNALVLWEAQFGDFVNGAQVIIDQFISSGEHKWLRLSGLVMLLPHGYEGQGPEHSSARLERFLQLCGEDNLQICNITTPANYFHALRRQVKRDFRKPLVIMTPKSLLRHKRCVSFSQDFLAPNSFHRIMQDHRDDEKTLVADKKIRRVVICSGKIYYDLLEEAEKHRLDDVYLLRIEQLYPYPEDVLVQFLSRFSGAEVVWAQEEPINMGAWTFLDRRLEATMEKAKMAVARPRVVGRYESASTATGSAKRHLQEKEAIMKQALL